MDKFTTAITIESTSSASTSFSKPASTGPDGIRMLKAMPSANSNDNEVRVIKASEYKAAALCLAQAFATDDVAMYFIKTPDRAGKSASSDWNLHLSIMEYVVLAHCIKGLALTVGPNYGCVALWMPPGKNMDDLWTIIRSGMWRLNYRLSPEGKKRFFSEFLPVLHDGKAEVLGDRDLKSWYLVYLGTKPEARGKGYARRIIEHVTRMADAEGLACYLESSNDINPIIYGKLGFEIKKKLELKRGEKPVVLDLMVREPAKRT